MPTSPNDSLRKGIQLGLVILVAVMPFHAFLSVWLGSLTHHQAIIQTWKELLLAIIAAMGVVLGLRDAETRDRLRTWPVLMAGLFVLIALVVTAATRPSFTAVAFGAKTDLEFLVAFVLAVMVATPSLIRRLTVAVLASAAVVVSFGLLQAHVLPPNFLTHFGYGPSTIVPYETIDPAIHTLRFAATLGGPNQLGTYLMLPLALGAVLAFRRRRWLWLLLVGAGALVLLDTYSRAAWLGALAGAIVLVLTLTPTRLRAGLVAILGVLALVGAGLLAFLLKRSTRLQYYLYHGDKLLSSPISSDNQHLASIQNGLTGSLARPFGHGLGTAGPAVFHSGQGPIIENNYLQVAFETGWAGLLAFVLLLAATARELAARSRHHDLAAAALAALVGISVTALFLPAWTDSSTALIFWTVAGAVIGTSPDSRHVSKQQEFDKLGLLGVDIDAATNVAAVDYICARAAPGQPACYVVKPYVEFLDRAYNNEPLTDLLNHAELALPDGVALTWAAAYLYAGKRSARRFWWTLTQIVVRTGPAALAAR